MGEGEGGEGDFLTSKAKHGSKANDCGLTEEYDTFLSVPEMTYCGTGRNMSLYRIIYYNYPENLDGGFNRGSIYPETQVLNVLKEDSFLPSSLPPSLPKSATSRTAIRQVLPLWYSTPQQAYRTRNEKRSLTRNRNGSSGFFFTCTSSASTHPSIHEHSSAESSNRNIE